MNRKRSETKEYISTFVMDEIFQQHFQFTSFQEPYIIGELFKVDIVNYNRLDFKMVDIRTPYE